jgi:minor curlin subunit
MAQEIPELEELEMMEQLNLLQLNSLEESNVTYIQQVGSSNQVRSILTQQGTSPNVVGVQQSGSSNSAYSDVDGSGHIVVIRQDGTGNEANVWSRGNLATTVVLQDGNYNLLNSYLENRGINSRTATLSQVGDRNKIEFALTGDGPLLDIWAETSMIRQSGSNLELNATFDSYSSPIQIEQQSGVGGGMSVDVSTSAFYFPMKR